MAIVVDIQVASDAPGLPEADRIRAWAGAALAGLRDDAELTIRIVDEEEGRQLNEHWRRGNGPTNVLSFPAGDDLAVLPELLGDVVICAPVVEREAAAQGKSPEAHWAHMVIHGILHLLGYDHQDDAEAAVMESLETEKLHTLGYAHPYH